jgi:WD40 repeat protein
VTNEDTGPMVFGIVDLDNRNVALWDTRASAVTHRLTLPLNAGRVRIIGAAKDNAWAFVLTKRESGPYGDTGDFFLWDLRNDRIDLRLEKMNNKRICVAAFSPDGGWVAIGANDRINGGMVQIRSLENRRVVKQFGLDKGQSLGALEFSPGGKYLIAHTVDRHIVNVDDVPTRREFGPRAAVDEWRGKWSRYVFRTSDWHRVEFRSFGFADRESYAFFADDSRLLQTHGSRDLRWYAVRNGPETSSRELLHLDTSGRNDIERFRPIAVDSSNDRIVLADGASLVVIRASDGKRLSTLVGHLGDVTVARFFPDGNWLATGSKDGTVRLWNLNTYELAVTLIAGTDGEWLALTPAGFYAGSDRPGHLVSIVHGQDVYSIEQFLTVLHRPDLVEEQLSGDIKGRYSSAAMRCAVHPCEGLNLEAVLERGPPPLIQSLEQKRLGDSIQIKIRIFNNSNGGIGPKLIWRVNGNAAGNSTPPELQPNRLPDPNGPAIVTESFRLDFRQPNIITVTAFNGALDPSHALATEPLEIPVDDNGLTDESSR